ncbi:MAG TPA: hypothetical protein DEQ90_08375 [Halieaceae bacterium]|nr:hypothetical protein [Halieaceae bacterium]
MDWVIVVLLISSLLNAAYFLPIVYRLWFSPVVAPWPVERRWGRLETSAWLFWPPLITTLMLVLVGLLAATAYSPLSWARLIVVRMYLP